jgi:CheY-like chemotaxis protein
MASETSEPFAHSRPSLPDEALERERTLRRTAEATAHKAQAASRMKDEFLATLSHELRTPLNAILGWTQTLKRAAPDPETLDRALSQIEQSAHAQARLIDDLLNVSDIVAGRIRLEPQPMRLSLAVRAVIEALHPSFDAKGIEVVTDWPQPREDVIVGDPVRLQQVFWNLLSNAMKFTPAGGRVHVVFSSADGVARVSIADSGEGIPPEFLPYVFERFTQADASSRKRHGGLGIGLAIARYLVELHGGTVKAESAGEGLGAVFSVCLPLKPWDGPAPADDAVKARERQDVADRAGARRLEGVRVLAVDDDRNSREMLQAALQHAGATVEIAGSAREALAQMKRTPPDVLVSDIGMPVEDGYDLLRQVRRLPPEEGGDVPAVALTGFAREEDRAMTWIAGFQAVAPKPVNLDGLISTLLSLVRRS